MDKTKQLFDEPNTQKGDRQDGTEEMDRTRDHTDPNSRNTSPNSLDSFFFEVVNNPPSKIGDYEILSEIARGGMGVVYKVKQQSLNRVVALKMILDGRLRNKESVLRFHQEAQAAAALDHPNIVPIYEIAEYQGNPYFTMAYVDGSSLKTVIKREGRLSPARAVEILLPVISAVAFAHEKGIIHRDLKPDNILIDATNRPRVTDFGLAKKVDGDSEITQDGQILGTPSFMAPEQAMGGRSIVGPAADVYAMGGILSYLLTGKAPFQGNSMTEVLCQVLKDPPVLPRQIVPTVPVSLDTIVAKCLAKSPKDRYASAVDLEAALRRADLSPASDTDKTLTSFSPSPSPLPSPPRSVPWISIALGAIAVVCAGLYLSGLFSPTKEQGSSTKAEKKTDVERTTLVLSNGSSTEIKPEVVTTKDPVPSALMEPSRNDFNLTVEVYGAKKDSKDVFQVKDKDLVKFRVTSPVEAWIQIWSIEANDVVRCVFPNKFEADGRLLPNVPRIIGERHGVFEAFPASPPQVESLRIIASTTKLEDTASQATHVRSLDKLVRGIRTRGIEVRGLKVRPQISDLQLEYFVNQGNR